MNGKSAGGGGAMLSPDTMQALRAVREQLATRKTELEQGISAIDILIGTEGAAVPVGVIDGHANTRPAKSNGKPLPKVKLPILGKAAKKAAAKGSALQTGSAGRAPGAMRLAVADALNHAGAEGLTTDEVRVKVKATDHKALIAVTNALNTMRVSGQLERDDETRRWRMIA